MVRKFVLCAILALATSFAPVAPPKPTSTAELRTASECKPMTEMRGSAPTAECLAQWGTPEPTRAAPEDQEDRIAWINLLDESFAVRYALAAIALCAY